MLQWLYTYVVCVYSKCSSSLRRMLHVFYLGVAYVSHLRCKCFNRMLHMFHTHVTSVSSRCCICFEMVAHVFSSCFRRMLQVFNYFGRVLQMFPLDVAKVRSGVAHVIVGPIYSSQLLQMLGRRSSMPT
jgi:hypothetical protein